MRRASLLLVLFLLACSRAPIDRSRWTRMPATEKRLYVQSLIGHEQAKSAKGGNDRVFRRPPTDYVAIIDDSYRRGDRRPPDTILISAAEQR